VKSIASLKKPEGKRFVKEFLDAWLKLDEINDTDPDRELYPGVRW